MQLSIFIDPNHLKLTGFFTSHEYFERTIIFFFKSEEIKCHFDLDLIDEDDYEPRFYVGSYSFDPGEIKESLKAEMIRLIMNSLG